MAKLTRIVVFVVVALGMATNVFAQAPRAENLDRTSSWGVQGSFTPSWVSSSQLEALFSSGDVDLSGSDLTVGFARGRMNSGEWGVSFLRKSVDRSSRIDDLSSACFGSTGGQSCYPVGNIWELRSVNMTGVEVYKFIPFVHVSRLQVGVTLAGGVAKMSGHVTKRTLSATVMGQTPTDPIIQQREVSSDVSIADYLADNSVMNLLPVGRVELTVAVRATSHIRVRMGGGFNFPGTSKFGVSTTYLF